jgi:hypothetical protein
MNCSTCHADCLTTFSINSENHKLTIWIICCSRELKFYYNIVSAHAIQALTSRRLDGGKSSASPFYHLTTADRDLNIYWTVILIYSLYISSSDYRASNWNRCGSGHDPNWDAIWAFVMLKWQVRNPQQESARTVEAPPEMQTMHLPNTSQKKHNLNWSNSEWVQQSFVRNNVSPI